MDYIHCWVYWPTDGLPSLLSLLTYWWATFTVEPTDGLHSLPSLLMGYILDRAFPWATFSAEPADGLPPLSSLLKGYILCRAYWWATLSVEPLMGYLLCQAYGWATVAPQLSLLMDYLHWIAYWWATYIAQYLYTSLNVLNYTSQGIWCFSFIFVDRETRNFTLTYLQSVVVPEQCLSPRPCLLIQYLIGSCTENCIACCAYNLPPPPPQYILFVP